MKIACVSDVHGKTNFKWPKADTLILAGDILPNFSYVKRSDCFMQAMWLEETFCPVIQGMLDKGLYDHVVMIPGNHDRLFQIDNQKARDILESIRGSFHLLIDEDTIVDGKVFYGSPWTPWFGGNFWAYNLPDPNDNWYRSRGRSRICWDNIPDDVEVLITHGPPQGILDEVARGQAVGCRWLKERIDKLEKLKLHVFGHIHESRGMRILDGLTKPRIFVNAAICTLDYKPVNPVQVVEI